MSDVDAYLLDPGDVTDFDDAPKGLRRRQPAPTRFQQYLPSPLTSASMENRIAFSRLKTALGVTYTAARQ